MIIVDPSYEILTEVDSDLILRHLEKCGRVCYKSENLINKDIENTKKFIRAILKRGHESVIEHYSITVKFTVNRGVSHELVRHRIASYSQESSRYCSYNKDKFGHQISIIKPCFYEKGTDKYNEWYRGCEEAEKTYFNLLKLGSKAEEARDVLPTALKTEIIITTNIREWRHIFRMRANYMAHPQMREVMIPLLAEFKKKIPVLFDDIEVRTLK